MPDVRVARAGQNHADERNDRDEMPALQIGDYDQPGVSEDAAGAADENLVKKLKN